MMIKRGFVLSASPGWTTNMAEKMEEIIWLKLNLARGKARVRL